VARHEVVIFSHVQVDPEFATPGQFAARVGNIAFLASFAPRLSSVLWQVSMCVRFAQLTLLDYSALTLLGWLALTLRGRAFRPPGGRGAAAKIGSGGKKPSA
jgi:hypothetical protein